MKRITLIKIFVYYILINALIYLFLFPAEKFSSHKYAYNDYGLSFLAKSNNVLFFLYILYIYYIDSIYYSALVHKI